MSVIAGPGQRPTSPQPTPKRSEPLHLPTVRAIDARLVGGSLLFGVGWGLVGLCPGPAIADIDFLDRRAALFVLAMAVGMALYSGLAAVPATPGAEVALDG